MELSRRLFCGGLAALAADGLFAAVPAVADDRRTLRKWAPGEFQIHFIHTGAGESQFLIFPDGTTMLLDCPSGQPGHPGRDCVPLLPNAARQAGEWVARYVRRVNPHGAEVDWLAVSHFHVDHVGGYYGAGTRSWDGGEYQFTGFALAAEQLTFRRAIDRVGPDFAADFMRPYVPKGGPMENTQALYRRLMKRDGLTVEKVRLGARDQIVPLRGGVPDFSVFNFCANGFVADGNGGAVDALGEDGRRALTKRRGFENPLSAGHVFRYGAFAYGTFGDFNMLWGKGRPRKSAEKNAAPHLPRLTVAKCNHHACFGTLPSAWIRAAAPRAWVNCVWTQGQSHPEILAKLADTALNPRLRAICPTVFPAERRLRAMAEKAAWLERIAPASFKGAHVVVTVPPGGKTFRLAQVDAGDERMRVLSEQEVES